MMTGILPRRSLAGKRTYAEAIPVAEAVPIPIARPVKPRYSPYTQNMQPRRRGAPGTMRQRMGAGIKRDVMRYKTTATSNTQVTARGICNSIGVISSTTSVAHPIAGSFRIKYVKIIGAPPLSGSSSIEQIGIKWNGDQNETTNAWIMNSTNNPNIPATIYARPVGEAAQWHTLSNSTDPTMFTFRCPVNSIFEIGLEYYFLTQNTKGTQVGITSFAGHFNKIPLAGMGNLSL